MPDGDILRHGISGYYSNAYQQICDDVPAEECAKALARSLKKLITNYGFGPRGLLKTVTPEFESLAQQSGAIQPKQLTQLDTFIERERSKCSGHRQGLDIATDTCKKVLYLLQSRGSVANIEFEVTSEFVRQVLERTFDTRIDGIKDPKLGEIPIEIFRERRQEIQPYLERYLDHFAKQIIRFDSTQKLRMPPSARCKTTTMGLDDVVE